MATREEMMTALRNADAAGATEDAARIARMIDKYDAEAKSPVPAAAPVARKPLGKPEPLTWTEELALGADKLISKMPSVGNQQLRQEGIDLASGAASTYRNLADVVSPGAGEKVFPSSVSSGSGWETAGQFIDPVMALTGTKAFQIASKALPTLGALRKSAVAGGAAGTAAAVPQAAAELRRGEGAEQAASTVGTGAVSGAALGPLLTGAGIVGEKAINLARRYMGGAERQVTDYLHKVFGGDVNRITQALDELKGLVPGERPTAGMAAVSGEGRFPQLKALEQEAAKGKTAATQFAEREAENQAVRTVPLEVIASQGRRPTVAAPGERVPMSPAEEARAAASDPLYTAAAADRVILDDPLTTLLAGPEVQGALRRGDAGFRQEIANAVAAGRKAPVPAQAGAPAQPAVPAQFDSMGMPKSPPMPATPATPGNLSIQQLQQVSQQLKKEINAINGPDPTGRKARLIDARMQLENMMEAASGTYGKARSAYREGSVPVNQAAVGEQLLSALRTPSGVERPGAYLNALENAPQTIKKAGAPRFEQIEQIMSPEQMAQINALRQSAMREQAYNALPSSPTMLPKMTNVAEDVESKLPPLLNVTMTVARKALRKLGGYSDEQAQRLLDQAMLDPAALSQLMKMLPTDVRSPLMAAINQAGVNSQGALISTSVANALREGQ